MIFFAVEIKVCNVGDDWWCTKNSNVFKLYVPMQIIFVFFDSFFKREDCIALVSTYIYRVINNVGQICFAIFIILVGLQTSFATVKDPFGDEGDVSIQFVADAENRHGDDASGFTKEVRHEFENFMPESDKW